MKNTFLKTGFAAAAAMLVLQTAALADNVQGRVAHASPSALSMVVYDPQGRPYPNQLMVKVDDQTYFQGVSSASGLKPNDAVSVDVSQEETGEWHADHVTKFTQVNAQPATKNPPPSLRDALGNPVVRGALVGAATGAIASGTSGGKAGKGALVGAGVGAAAGLLESWFSQPQPQSSDNQ